MSKASLTMYFELLEIITETNHILEHYPTMRFPEKLLPAKKSDLEEEIKRLLDEPGSQNPLYRIRLERGLWYLSRFDEASLEI